MTGGFELRGKHVLVIGLARTGIATARFCAEHGATVTATDTHCESELGAEVLSLREEGVKLELGAHPETSFAPSGPCYSESGRSRRRSAAALGARTKILRCGAKSSLPIAFSMAG